MSMIVDGHYRFSIVLSAVLAAISISSEVSCQEQQSAGYDEKVAMKLMAMAGAAYALVPDECIFRTFPVEDEWRRESTHKYRCDTLGNYCSGFVAISAPRRQLVVAFRGTQDEVQLVNEIFSSIRPQLPFHGLGKVNKYFFNGMEVLWPVIEPLLRNPDYQDFNVAFTGHSLGGAMAVLAAARTVVQGIRTNNQVVVYTFGEPRVGNPEFAHNYNRLISSSYRVVHNDDVVPHIPFCSENLFGQESKPCNPTDSNTPFHQGLEIWYPNDMSENSTYIECRGEPYGEDFSCSDRLKFHFYKINHYMETHRHYFARRVSAFGKLGCVIGDPREETLPSTAVTGNDWRPSDESKKSNIIRRVKSLGQLLGLQK